jgi:outer membrane lipoprotein SlyB
MMEKISSPRLHPLVAAAAVAVTAFSLAGIAAIAGFLPPGKAESEAQPAFVAAAVPAVPTASPVAGSQAAVPPAPTFAPQPVAAESKPAVKHAVRPVAKPVAKTAAAALPAPPPCIDCGTVDNVRELKQEGTGSGVGAVAGGLLGGILGHQVGQGSGNKIATVLGAVGGAYAGHQVEKSRNRAVRYEIVVRMDDGTRRTLQQDSVPAWRIGARVRVENGALAPLSHEAGMPPAPAAYERS